jgi:hypothetical protein
MLTPKRERHIGYFESDIYAGAIRSSPLTTTLFLNNPYQAWTEHGGRVESISGSFPEHPIVVAPTRLKFVGSGARQEEDPSIFGYLNQSPQITDVWGAMEREMLAAKAWVFIGYSFPSSDLYFSSVLRSTLAGRDSNPFVAIVNPDAMAISQRIANRFYIPQDRIKTFPDLETFNQINRAGMLSMFD